MHTKFGRNWPRIFGGDGENVNIYDRQWTDCDRKTPLVPLR